MSFIQERSLALDAHIRTQCEKAEKYPVECRLGYYQNMEHAAIDFVNFTRDYKCIQQELYELTDQPSAKSEWLIAERVLEEARLRVKITKRNKDQIIKAIADMVL